MNTRFSFVGKAAHKEKPTHRPASRWYGFRKGFGAATQVWDLENSPRAAAADTLSHPQQHKSNRGQLSAIAGGVGGWVKHKNKETQEKKVKITVFFLFVCAWCNNSQKKKKKKNKSSKITPFHKPKFDYEWKNKVVLTAAAGLYVGHKTLSIMKHLIIFSNCSNLVNFFNRYFTYILFIRCS